MFFGNKELEIFRGEKNIKHPESRRRSTEQPVICVSNDFPIFELMCLILSDSVALGISVFEKIYLRQFDNLLPDDHTQAKWYFSRTKWCFRFCDEKRWLWLSNSFRQLAETKTTLLELDWSHQISRDDAQKSAEELNKRLGHKFFNNIIFDMRRRLRDDSTGGGGLKCAERSEGLVQQATGVDAGS